MLNAGPPRDHAWIAAHVPHQGRMCLLERVLAWDETHIVCEAIGHADPAHPLRDAGRLGAAIGVEYAAQAMAVHGALIDTHSPVADSGAGAGERPAALIGSGAQAARSGMPDARPAPPATALAPGYLASVRALRLHTDRLDTVAGPLRITATRLSGDSRVLLYGFKVEAAERSGVSGSIEGAPGTLDTPSSRCLLEGRASVVLGAVDTGPG